jgi:penicillin-binding protein 1A
MNWSISMLLIFLNKLNKLRSKLSLSTYIKNKYLLWPIRCFYILLIYWIFLELNLFWAFGRLPNFDDVKNPPVAIASEVYGVDSVLIAKFYTENRTPIPINQVSENAINALIATEDIRFRQHHGFDLKGLLAGFFSTVKGDQRGASTLTQQLAKNMFRTRDEVNQGWMSHLPIIGKLIDKTKEWAIAIKLELYYSKDEILEMYFNTVEFGNNWFGLKIASQNYFGKQPSALNTQEAATLVGLLKATTSYNPIKYKARSLQRRNVVLSQMEKYNFISATEADSLKQLPIVLKSKNKKGSNNEDSYLRTYIESVVTPWCEANGYLLYEDGLKIYTTIDSRLQKFAEESTTNHLKKLQKEFYRQWGNKNPWVDDEGNEIPEFLENNIKVTSSYKDLAKVFKSKDSVEYYLRKPHPTKVFTWSGIKDTVISAYDSLRHCSAILQAGFVAMDPFDACVRAYVGGIDYKYFKYDHVVQARRQPGSTFKTFAYTAAIDCGGSPCDVRLDQPVKIIYEGGQVWEPKNSTGGFSYKNKTLRRAFAQSVNSITAQITEEVGWQTVIDYARMMGISSPLAAVPSISLGSSDVSVYEMAKAYGVILNDGYKFSPIIVSSVYSKDGKMLANFTAHKVKVLSDETCFLMRHMLLGGIQEPGGTSQALWGYNIFGNGNEVAGKTGTTSNYSDAWYVALTRNLVCATWVGTDFRAIHLKGASGQGSRAALPIFAKFMEKALAVKHPLIKTGKFSKPVVKISKPYYCAAIDSALMAADSSMADTLLPAITDTLETIIE